jgi:hypothetical protein
MNFLNRASGALAISCLFLASTANAALEVELHEVNTSVGLAHTAANTWKLETDPVIPASVDDIPGPYGENLDEFYPISGTLDNTFDPNTFRLATAPPNGPSDALGLGYSVEGIAPFGVSSFEVPCYNSEGVNDGSYFLVQQTGDNGFADTVTAVGDPDQLMETGQVNDINFYLIASDKTPTEPMPITVDQDFFQLNLVPLNGDNNVTIVPELYSASGGPNGSLTISDPDGNTDTTTSENGVIVTSYVPEPSSAMLIGIPAMMLLKRSRRSN